MKDRLKSVTSRITGLFGKKTSSLLKEDRDATDGVIAVSDVLPELGIEAGELVQIGSGLVMHSDCHDLARALLSRSTDMLVTPFAMEDVEYIPQKVFTGKNDLGEYWFGYADYFHEKGIEIPSSLLNMMRLLYADEKETFLVAKDGRIIGLISLQQT